MTFALAGLSSDYQHLQVRWEAVSTRGSDQDDMLMQVNNNTTTSAYSYGGLYADGSSGQLLSGYNNAYYGFIAHSLPSRSNEERMVGVTTFFDPFETTKNKSWIHQRGTTNGWYAGTGDIGLIAGTYYSTTALSHITYRTRLANLAAKSRFSIYGLRSVTSVGN